MPAPCSPKLPETSRNFPKMRCFGSIHDHKHLIFAVRRANGRNCLTLCVDLPTMNEQLKILARKQHGLVTSRQVVELESRSWLRTQIRNGFLEELRRGVNKIAGAPETWEQTMLAATLAGPTGSVASNKAAGRIWGLRYCRNAAVEIAVPRNASHDTPFAKVRQTNVPGWQQTVRNGIPVMSVTRTIISLSRSLSLRQLGCVVDDCLDAKLVSLTAIKDTLIEIGSQGRPRSSFIWQVLDDRSGADKTRSHLERETLKWLQAANIEGYELQYPIFAAGRAEPYHLDFYWPDLAVAVEPDGFNVHDNRRSAFDDDRTRRNAITALGIQMLHVTTNTDEKTFLRDLNATLKRAKAA